jgi:hypothetical protein
MKFVAGLYVDNIDFRTVEGPSTKIDISGAFFSFKPNSYPEIITPHLVLLISAVNSSVSNDTLVCEFRKGEEIVARNVQPCPIEIGKFGYRLVRPELEFDKPETIIVTCTLTESKTSIEIPLTSI